MNAQLPIRTEHAGLNEIRATRGFHWWYPSIIDRMIAHPEWTKQEIAKDLGVSYSTIYLVTSCDLFRAHLAKRREEISSAHDRAIGERLAKVATTALDKMLEHIESKPGNALPLPQLVELSDKVLSRLGYGEARAPAGVTINNINAPIDARSQSIRVSTQDLLEARNALRNLEGNRTTLLQAEPSVRFLPHRADGDLEALEVSTVNSGSSDKQEGESVPLSAL